jgi:VanZ family protein
MIAFPRTVILKLVAWSCLVTIGVLSLLPSAYVKRTGLGGHLEHVAAYLLTAALFCLAYRSRRHFLGITTGLAAAAALFEIGQAFSTGRTPSLEDWMASSTGVVAGAVIGFLVARLLSSPEGQREPQ